MTLRRLCVGLFCIVMMVSLVSCVSAIKAPVGTGTPNPGATATAAAGATPAPGTTPVAGDLAARVNGQPIARAAFEEQVARFEAAMVSQGQSFSGEDGKPVDQQVRTQVLESMIDQVLIEQSATVQGITITDDVLRQRIDADIQAAGGQEKFDQSLRVNNLTKAGYEAMMRSTLITDEVVRRLGTKIPETLKQYHVRQIIVATESQAKDLRKRLDKGEDFADLATKYSQDEGTRAQGGDRGYLALGYELMPAEVEKAVAGLGAGKVAGPIAANPGFYLVQVIEIQDNRQTSAEMRQGLTRDALMSWLETQRASAKIERFVALG
jgi:foldase protein PrsA